MKRYENYIVGEAIPCASCHSYVTEIDVDTGECEHCFYVTAVCQCQAFNYEAMKRKNIPELRFILDSIDNYAYPPSPKGSRTTAAY